MARPVPEWIDRVKAMQSGEIIMVSSPLSRQTVKYHARKFGKFMVREMSTGLFKISAK